jgi:hypothetical protein
MRTFIRPERIYRTVNPVAPFNYFRNYTAVIPAKLVPAKAGSGK